MQISTARGCLGTNRMGEACRAFPVGDGDFCFWHSPLYARERALACRAGGRARHGRRVGSTGAPVEPVAIETVDDLLKLLGQTVNDLLTLENSIARGRAVIQAIGAGCKLLELSTLADRIQALEERLQ